MIIVDEKSVSTSNLQFLEPPLGVTRHDRAASCSSLASGSHLELPPPYGTSSRRSLRSTRSSVSLVSVNSTSTPSPGPNSGFTQRSNHLYITRGKGSVKGSWIIDTGLSLPSAMLPRLQDDSLRKNFRVHAKEGRVSARVEVRGRGNPSEDARDQRAHLFFRSDNGPVKLRLRRTELPKLQVTCEAPKGTVIIYLPYNFEGPVRAQTLDGTVALSPGIQKQATTISQNSRKCVFFIGNCPKPSDTWDKGDEVDIDAREGRVKILYVDEHEDFKLVSSVNNMVTNIKSQGMMKYVERVVSEKVEKVLTNGKNPALQSCGKQIISRAHVPVEG